jgi:hypothetical protein
MPDVGVVGSGPTRRLYSVPLVVAVTGHRDLLPDEVPALRERVRAFLLDLRSKYPGRDLLVMSALAEGADRLVAEEALALALPLTVPLPMAKELYLDDFATEESREQFERLCAAATDVFELPLTPGNTAASIEGQGPNRARQYAQAGVFVSAHCHILLALWDGRPSEELGGTAQVVRFHQDDVMPGYTPRATASRLTLTDDESDLVYHVVVSRDRAGGQPADGLRPLECWWFTRDEARPRTTELPDRYRVIFARTSEFNLDMHRHAQQIAAGGYPLLDPSRAAQLPAGLRDIDEIFTAADWLAIRYQQFTLRTLRATHVFVLLIGVTYVSYTDVVADRMLLLVLLAQMLLAAALGFLATRGEWHRKYLDYRTLAEGLRVQFYWAAAGVTSGNVTKFSHDNFLQMQDPDLGWIRNVMRVTGTECDVRSVRSEAGLALALDEWIGDERRGQLGYFRRKTAERIGKSRATRRLSNFGLAASASTLVVLLTVSTELLESLRGPLVFAVGCVLLMIGVRQAYAKATGESEIIKQYEFMIRIFANARRRIAQAENDGERRQVLRILGDSALEEHAEWILMHRQHSIDARDIVRLS